MTDKDKLSELSKPVAYKFDHGVMGPGDFKYGTPQMHSAAKDENASSLYSQEYVSAILSELEAKDNRITELEAKTAMTMGVGSGNGNLFVHGDYDSIKAAQAIVLENESLRAKLATPVRLSFETHPRCRTQHAKDVRAAGFTVSEE